MKFYISYPNDKKAMSKYGLNAIYAGKHWTKRRQDSEYWHYHVRNELRKQGIKKHIFEKPVRICFGWNRRLDIDNYGYMEKMIIDSLKGYFITDDSRKYLISRTSQFCDLDMISVEIKEAQ